MELGREIRAGFAHDLEREAARKIIGAIDKWRKGGRIKTANRRWLFELIQNAVDISRERGTSLEIEITSQANQVLFRHNAGYFSPKEIRALIYAYSTKPYERESELAGRFATGFLVTHIVSEKVIVRSVLEKDGGLYDIEIMIDRESDKIENIFEKFSQSFNQLNDATRIQSDSTEFWTEYVYEIGDDIGKEAITVGFMELEKCLPFLFVFNNITKITINGVKYTKEEVMRNEILIEKVGTTQVWLASSQDMEVAVIVDSTSNRIINVSEFPRLFVKGLPLIGTEDYLKIPYIVNSTKFRTTEDRNTLENTEENSETLRKAFILYQDLLGYISRIQRKEMRGLYLLSNFQLVPEKRISENPLWDNFNSLLKKNITEIVKNYALVDTFEGRKEIANTIFPIKFLKSKELQPEVFNKFYDLLVNIKDNIPTKDELDYWIIVASNLKAEFGDTANVILYNIENMKNELVEFVKGKSSYPSLQILGEGFDLSDPKQFLLSFFDLLNDLYERKVIESVDFVDYLLIDQTGIVGPFKWEDANLCVDKDIPEDLKDIIQKIGWKIRLELLDRDLTAFKIVEDFIRDFKDVPSILEYVIDKHKISDEEIKEEPWKDKLTGWLELFRWCTENGNLCKDFTVVTKAMKIRPIENLNFETLIIPFKHMGIKEEYEDIYPENRILHHKYLDVNNPKKLISYLEHYDAFVTNLPLYKKEVTFGWNKLKSVLLEDVEISKVDHKIEASIDAISVLPFWSDVVGRISEYQERAQLLFRFVVYCLVENDKSWDNCHQARCSCRDGNHKIIPSQWLASLKTDAWVPSSRKENGEEKIVKTTATKESIENLFTTNSFEKIMKDNTEKITKLLTHFGFNELDLKIKLQSMERGISEEKIRKEVSVLVDITKVIPDLPDIARRDIQALRETIEKLKGRLEFELITEENRNIGKNLEAVIAEILSSKAGIAKVKPIYRGGDLVIWPERNEGWDSGLIEISPYFMEVKFTSGARAHLSRVQGETSMYKKERFIVLVVENAVGLRTRLLLLNVDEGPIPEDLIVTTIENSHIVKGIYQKLGSFPNPDEVEPDIHGYWIKRKLWDNKVDLLEWIKQTFPPS